MKPFGLRNKNGSCWINAALQAIFRIPEVQQRLNDDQTETPVEECLAEIWASRGDEGLKALFECIKVSSQLPAGEGIGDSHELIEFLCDKIPFLDKLMRFKVVNKITCKHCPFTVHQNDTFTEFSIAPNHAKQTVADAIAEAVKPVTIDDWKCDDCSNRGCTKQLFITEFPDVLMFHQTSMNTTTSYTPVIVMNNIRYALFSIVCFAGKHWFTWGRDLPPGKPWYRFDDQHVQSHSATFMPHDDRMRLLMYYRLKE